MKEAPHDYSADLKAPTSEGLEELATLAAEMYLAEIALEESKEKVKEAQANLDRISQGRIPQLMETLGLSDFTTKDGVKLSVGSVLRVSPPKDRKPEAYKWLDDNGFGDLVKRNVVIGFNRGEEDLARKLSSDLENQGLRTKDEISVAPQTLRKWVKDRMDSGKPIDMELFGVYTFDQAKITSKPEDVFGD